MIGAPPKNEAKLPASRVADESTTFKSVRLSNSRCKYPRIKSIFSERSWASSMMRVSYSKRSGSRRVSARRMPSVMNLIRVATRSVLSSNRTWQPTSRPSSTSISVATRRATEVAAIRRGWVQPIRFPSPPRPRANTILGSCVVFPEPVSPQTITTGCFAMAVLISSRQRDTGSSSGKWIFNRLGTCKLSFLTTTQETPSLDRNDFQRSRASRYRSRRNLPVKSRESDTV
jgi:hypothetical protein